MQAHAFRLSYLSNTLIGYSSQLMWAALPLYLSMVMRIPTFEILACAFTISFVLTFSKIAAFKEFKKIRFIPAIWAAGIVGIVGNESLFIFASKYAPLDRLTVIFNLWPLLVLLLSSCLPSEKFSYRYFIPAVICLVGLYVGIVNRSVVGEHEAYLGYGAAFLSALVWSVYILVARRYQHIATEMVGMYCGVGAIICSTLHVIYEPTVVPTIMEAGFILLMGLTTEGAAYFLWDHGIKHGNYKLLCLLGYTNPILCIVLLAIFGFSQLTLPIVFAAVVIVSMNLWVSRQSLS